MSGVTIFSVMSVRTVNVGTTMKSMNPAYTEKFSAAEVCSVNARITELPFETLTEQYLHIQMNQNQIKCSHCSPI